METQMQWYAYCPICKEPLNAKALNVTQHRTEQIARKHTQQTQHFTLVAYGLQWEPDIEDAEVVTLRLA